ncbi:MAG: hypothetical protein MJZ49_08730, partial [Bacteroidales bacterium]|nr:hypothetical protein [Bacteroidales bacterium]
DYEKSVLEYEDVQEAIAYARELAAEEAFGKGMEKGREEGMEKGREEGMVKGMEKATILIAKNLLKKGLDIPTIVAATGLTEQEVLQLTV